MKFAIAMILAVVAIVPAVADGGKLSAEEKEARIQARISKLPPAARARIQERRAKFAAMSPEERAEHRRKAMEARKRDTSAERARRTAEITAKLAAAKAACGPDCYRVIQTNGVYVGMTKAQYEAHQAKSAAKHRVTRAKGKGTKARGVRPRGAVRPSPDRSPTIKK